MLALGVDFFHIFRGGRHSRINIRPSAARDGLNLFQHRFFVRQLLRLDDPPRRIVERDDADRIFRPHQLDGAHRRFFGQFDLAAAHAARTVNDQNQTQLGNFAFAFQLHRYRQRLLDRRIEVSAESETLIAAAHHKSDPVTANRRFDRIHFGLTQRIARYVVEQNAVVLRVIRQFGRKLSGRNDRRIDQSRV